MTKHSDRPENGRRLRPSNDASRIAGDLAQFSSGTPAESDLLAGVDEAIHSRSLRAGYLPPHLLGEPAWDILLELLRADLTKQAVTMAQLGMATGLPSEIAGRWVEALIENGLCGRGGAGGDRGIKLTPEGGAILRTYFAQLPRPAGGRQP